MGFKTKLCVAASVVALAGGMMMANVHSAHATPTQIGECDGSLSLVKLHPALTDQTQVGVRYSGALAKSRVTGLPASPGICTGIVRPGNPSTPQPPSSLYVKSMTTVLVGNVSCANGPTAQALDASAGLQYQAYGTITWVFNDTYTDPVAKLVKHYKIVAEVELQDVPGTPVPNGDGSSNADITGIVTQGVNAGSTLSGQVWMYPVVPVEAPYGWDGTAYNPDFVKAFACADEYPNNNNVPQVLMGYGSYPPGLFSNNNSPLTFSIGK